MSIVFNVYVESLGKYLADYVGQLTWTVVLQLDKLTNLLEQLQVRHFSTLA